MKRKILRGYVENRTKEAALAAVLAALTFVGRNIQIPIFIPPIHGLEVSICFWCIAIIVLSYPYVWLITLMMSFTSPSGLLIFPSLIISLSIFYFICRLIGINKAKYFTFFASIINMIVWLIFWRPIAFPQLPFEVYFIPMMIKASAQGILALAVIPVILKVFEKFSIIGLNEEAY